MHAIYRIAPTRKSEVRPDWFSQRSCLGSFMAAVEEARSAGIALRSTVVIDGELSPDLMPELEWFDHLDHIRLLGNSPAFRYAFEVATNSNEEIILFAEDDYMWTRNSILETIRLLLQDPTASYASPYAHPVRDDESQPDVRRHRSVSRTVADVVWRSTSRTTMTFACRTQGLRQTRQYWWLASYGKSPKDSYAFGAVLEGRWFKLVGNAGFRDVRRVINLATVRLVAECTLRRLRPATRPILFQPEESLATHVHQPFITGATDWKALASACDGRPA